MDHKESGWEGIAWSYLAKEPGVPYNAVNVLTSLGTVSV